MHRPRRGQHRAQQRHPSRHARLPAALMAALAGGAILASGSAPAAPDSQVTAAVTPAELTIGDTTRVNGRLAAAVATGTPLVLQSEPYPLHRFTTIARTAAAADGSFSFNGLRPDRNARLRVLTEAQPASVSAELIVTVDPRVSLSSRSLGRGRTLLNVRVRHALLGSTAPVTATWFVAALGSRVFHLAAVTDTREPLPGLLVASATVDPPSRRFAYRVCTNPTWEHAMGPRATHGPCPSQDFLLPARDAD